MIKQLKELLNKSVFLDPQLKEQVLIKIAKTEIPSEVLKEAIITLQKIIKTEESVIKEILQKDPLYFTKLEHENTREILQKQSLKEEKENSLELKLLEEEFNKIL